MDEDRRMDGWMGMKGVMDGWIGMKRVMDGWMGMKGVMDGWMGAKIKEAYAPSETVEAAPSTTMSAPIPTPPQPPPS